MSTITSFLAIFLTIQAASSYILLTANLEDVQAIAKQLANSPVVDQINKIWRRATNQFNTHVAKARPVQRTREDDATKSKYDEDAPEQHARVSNEEIESTRNEELHESYLSGHEDFQQPFDGRRKMQPENERKDKEDDEDLVALGKNASVYLKSIRKIFQDI